MKIPSINWPVWAGLLLSVAAFLSYFLFFVQFPVTRDVPWANLLLFAIAAALLWIGVRRAFRPGRRLVSKLSGLMAVTLSMAIFGFFIFSTFVMARRLPASRGAPQVGQKAPEFSLTDSGGKQISLSELLQSPIKGRAPRGVLLVFYRGYW